jgi:hypothetical protein
MFNYIEMAFQLEIQKNVERMQGYSPLTRHTNMLPGEKNVAGKYGSRYKIGT